MKRVAPLEVRRNADGSLDEVVARCADVHLEQMHGRGWFLSVGDVKVWLESGRAIHATVEDERPAEEVERAAAASRRAIARGNARLQRAVVARGGS